MDNKQPFVESLLSRKIVLKITDVGKNLEQNLKRKIQFLVEGKCITEGYIKPKSVQLVSQSCGLIKDDHVEFQVIYKCMVCNPPRDVEIDCTVNHVTKAGIHAQVVDEAGNVPITIFVARDHHDDNTQFEHLSEKDQIRVKVIGTRFELNDTSITAIAFFIQKL